jgi:hypothetical protein
MPDEGGLSKTARALGAGTKAKGTGSVPMVQVFAEKGIFGYNVGS